MKVSKNLNKVYNDMKDYTLKTIQINLILEIFICLILELLELILNFYSLEVTFFIEICDFKFMVFGICIFTIFFEFALFFPIFPNMNCQVVKFKNKN